jgi:nascent polypeptide-associated complex subunit alpha
MSTENSQTSIQSRGEQKARKAILALGLKPVAGVNRVTFTRGRGVSLLLLLLSNKVLND